MSKQLQQLTLSSVNVKHCMWKELGDKSKEIFHNLGQPWAEPLILISPGQIFSVTNVEWIEGVGGFAQLYIKVVGINVQSLVIFRECVDLKIVNRDSGQSIGLL